MERHVNGYLKQYHRYKRGRLVCVEHIHIHYTAYKLCTYNPSFNGCATTVVRSNSSSSSIGPPASRAREIKNKRNSATHLSQSNNMKKNVAKKNTHTMLETKFLQTIQIVRIVHQYYIWATTSEIKNSAFCKSVKCTLSTTTKSKSCWMLIANFWRASREKQKRAPTPGVHAKNSELQKPWPICETVHLVAENRLLFILSFVIVVVVRWLASAALYFFVAVTSDFLHSLNAICFHSSFFSGTLQNEIAINQLNRFAWRTFQRRQHACRCRHRYRRRRRRHHHIDWTIHIFDTLFLLASRPNARTCTYTHKHSHLLSMGSVNSMISFETLVIYFIE